MRDLPRRFQLHSDRATAAGLGTAIALSPIEAISLADGETADGLLHRGVGFHEAVLVSIRRRSDRMKVVGRRGIVPSDATELLGSQTGVELPARTREGTRECTGRYLRSLEAGVRDRLPVSRNGIAAENEYKKPKNYLLQGK